LTCTTRLTISGGVLVALLACGNGESGDISDHTYFHMPNCKVAPCVRGTVDFFLLGDRFRHRSPVPQDRGALGVGCIGAPGSPPVPGFNPMEFHYDTAEDTWSFSCVDQETSWSFSATLVRPRRQLGPCLAPGVEDQPDTLRPSWVYEKQTFRFSDGFETWDRVYHDVASCQVGDDVTRGEVNTVRAHAGMTIDPRNGDADVDLELYYQVGVEVWLAAPSGAGPLDAGAPE